MNKSIFNYLLNYDSCLGQGAQGIVIVATNTNTN